MATIKCGCYGTLGAVAGPLQHCPTPLADGNYYPNYPFYSGPCPPGPKPPCKPCCPCGCRPCPYEPEPAVTNRCAALLTAGAPQDIASGGEIPLAAQLINPEAFAAAENGVVIRRAGLYMAIFCINLPPMQTVGTRCALCLNGAPIDASKIHLTCAPAGANTCLTGQALIQAMPNSRITLNTESALSLDVPSPIDNVFSLSLVKIQ